IGWPTRSRNGTPRLRHGTRTDIRRSVRSTSPPWSTSMADVRVGIVSWNTGDLLDRCLAAVPAAVAGLDAEIAGVEVIRNETNEGYARGMNRALAGTDAPVLVALNPDTEPPPKSLAALVTSLRDRPRAALVVPRLCNEDGSLQPSVQRFPSLSLAVVSGFVPKRWQRGALGRRWWLEGA